MRDTAMREPLWGIARIGDEPLVERLWRQRPGVVILFSSETDAQRVAMHPHTVDRSGDAVMDAWEVCPMPAELLDVLRADRLVQVQLAGAVSAEGHYAAAVLGEER